MSDTPVCDAMFSAYGVIGDTPEAIKVRNLERDLNFINGGGNMATSWLEMKEKHDAISVYAEGLKATLEWIVRDAAYKAPEQLGDVAMRWLDRATTALAAPSVAQGKPIDLRTAGTWEIEAPLHPTWTPPVPEVELTQEQLDAVLAYMENPTPMSPEATARIRASVLKLRSLMDGSDTYTAPVPAGFTHALDCAYKRSVRNHCTCGYVDREGA